MRTRLSNTDEVIHVWAQQNQDEGRCGNVYFQGKSIFSYGSHFEMARFLENGVVLITTRRYSVTTSSHLSGVRQAVSHLKSFEVPTFDDHKANAAGYLTDLTEMLYTISRMRSDPEWRLREYKRMAKAAAEYVELFKKGVPADVRKQVMAIYAKADNPLTADQVAKFKKRAADDREKTKAENARRAALQAERLAAAQVDLDGWAAGANSSRSFYDMPVRLRVKDGEIQTSKGAQVPLIEARKLWHAITEKKAIEGMRVGHYTVTGIKDGALVVGCHVIPLREVYKMAQALNWGTFQMEVA